MTEDHGDHDDHDLGLAHDLPRMVGRRRLLALFGGLGLAAASGAPAAALQCVGLPWETAGPYPADGSNTRDGQVIDALRQEGVIRRDLRGSFGEMTEDTEGVPLQLDLQLIDADGCTPLAGHAIYVWHCDATGHYSLYDAPQANWLRGVGIADDEGHVTFTTIVPGCYDGRWPHIHFEVFESAGAAVSGADPVLTAQIALPADVCARVYAADARYSNGTRNLGRISLARDNVFGDNSAAELAQQTLSMTGTPGTGYAGAVIIPVDFDADRDLSMPPPPGDFGGGTPPRPPEKG
ncbi:dioxygenase family protein [Allosediminivita pacifica]|uniref:Dioxygenase-like protein n=1 Tax=Allosediminivita pacifica TaxID=1267769 RepID=A0A2T6AXB3_9RHOB|nr:hypothetical protein [Allosediminivita pacifica]PTX48467.1 dioxygenase-like protein [Allosediminivita pacifica]GGB10295.1 hypothetical protein GCM10011324_20410 [Allosediminivita pacifica]